MNSQNYLNGIVPCSIVKCINIATVFAVKGTGTFESGFYCDIHLPTGWKIQDGSLGSLDTDIIRNQRSI